MKTIKKIGVARFQIATPGVKNSEIELDFNPIISTFNLDKGRRDYKLFHWQGRPKGYREWGIYDRVADQYMCGIFPDHPTIYGGMRLLMLDDATVATLPSAVLWYVGKLPNM